MTNPPVPIRVANKALIIRDQTLLVTVNEAPKSDLFYLCPGGGQEHGEDARQGMRRECQEEIGCDVIVGELAFVRDYIGAFHEFADFDSAAHQQENYFFCDLAPGQEPTFDGVGDQWQTGIAWLPLDQLKDLPVWPKALGPWLTTPAGDRPLYLGDVN